MQIGVFKNRENAVALAKQYKKLGHDAFTFTSSFGDKGIMYRVLIGNFRSKKEALKAAREISSKEKINTIIFSE